jgi:hypothetical protein
VMIIDWNLGLARDQLDTPQTPAGAVFVQGFEVLRKIEVRLGHRYTHRDDLQSLVRALYLLAHNVAISVCVCGGGGAVLCICVRVVCVDSQAQ